MKWRLIDRIDRFEPWQHAAGAKTVSFEEYSLLKRLGRKGAFPESLVLDACVELARWLVAGSSDFAQVAALEQIEDFAFRTEAGRGDVLEISLTTLNRDETHLALKCAVAFAGREVASGKITVNLSPLSESFDREWLVGLWQELRRSAHAQA